MEELICMEVREKDGIEGEGWVVGGGVVSGDTVEGQTVMITMRMGAPVIHLRHINFCPLDRI